MEQEQDYTKGFNEGFKISKYKPELLSKILEGIKGVNDYERGFLAGTHELERQRKQNRENDLLDIRDKKEHGKDRDITR